MGRRCEEWFEEDGSEQLETKYAGEEAMERNNWTSQNSQRVVELKKKKKRRSEHFIVRHVIQGLTVWAYSVGYIITSATLFAEFHLLKSGTAVRQMWQHTLLARLVHE